MLKLKAFEEFMEQMDLQRKIAEELIREFHDGQTDLSGRPYIKHLYRVAEKIDRMTSRTASGRYTERDTDLIKAEIAALLHDILEDTECTEDVLRERGISKEIIDTVKVLTRPDELSYFDYILIVDKHPLARIVKMCDLEDNMDIRRLKTMSEGSIRRLKKYWAAWKFLVGEIKEEKAKTIIEAK